MKKEVQFKIGRLIEEAGPALIMGAGLYPTISSALANIQVEGIQSKKDLEDFKKKYSGFSDYKTYDSLSGNMKRGAAAGAAIGLPLGAILASQKDDDALETGAGIGGLILATGLGGGAIRTGLHKAFGNVPLKDKVEYKERQFK